MKLYTLLAFFAAVQLSEAVDKCLAVNGDNLIRCFLHTPGPASSYCSSFLSIPTSTVTFTPSATVTLPSFASTETDVLTSTTITTSYYTSVQTTVLSVYTTTTTTGVPIAELNKRQAAASPFSCPYVSQKGSILYAATSISSACSCLSVTPQTVTNTASTVTKTSYTSATTTTSTSTTFGITTTSIAASTQTNIETDVITSTVVDACYIRSQDRADCSSFLRETVTPATPSTTLSLQTTYSVIGSKAKRTAGLVKEDLALNALLLSPSVIAQSATVTAVHRRQVSSFPDKVPDYASACSGTARYSSACSVAGITMATTTLPVPATITIKEYASAIPVCDAAQNYGFNHRGGIAASSLTYNIIRTADTQQGCCARCYALETRCFFYSWVNGCNIYYETSGSHPPTDYCPYGVFAITNPGAGDFYGLGPCGYFA